MNWQIAFDTVLPILIGIIGFLVRNALTNLNDKIAADAGALKEFKESTMLERAEWRRWREAIPDIYAKKDAVDRAFDKVEAILERMGENTQQNFDKLNEKLDRKADRSH